MKYQGEITERGDLEPFSIGALDKVHADAVNMMSSAQNVEVTDDPAKMQALLIRSATKLHSLQDFQKYPELKHVARAGVGMDNIDMALASQMGIATINTPGASSVAVARRALTFILHWAAKINRNTELLREGKWLKGDKSLETIDTGSMTLGIVGYGRIGRKLHSFVRELEDLFGKVQFSDVANIPDKVDLDALIQQSDAISVHVNGDEEVLTPKRILTLKNDSLVVNTARGNVVNTEAMLQAMNEKNIHYSTDVYAREKPDMFENDVTKRLIAHPNFVGTQHTAATDKGTQRALGLEAAERTLEFAQEGKINSPGLPGQTLGKVMPSQKNQDTVRTVLFHAPSTTIRREVLGFAQSVVKNVSVGETVSGPFLQCTIMDIETTDPKTAAHVARSAIRRIGGILKHRIFLLTEKQEWIDR